MGRTCIARVRGMSGIGERGREEERCCFVWKYGDCKGKGRISGAKANRQWASVHAERASDRQGCEHDTA